MREFERTSRLGRLPLPARLIYSGFLLFTLVAIAVTLWLTDEIVGLGFQKFDEYYRGISAQQLVETQPGQEAAPSSGPVLDLPDELQAPAKAEPKSLRSVLEVTHFHLFTMPLYWMVLAHLFALSSFRWFKPQVITSSGLAVAAHLCAPWLARAGVSFSHVYYAVTGTVLGAGFLVMAIVPLVELWRGSGAPSGGSPR
jgi:hypothetical protein